MAVVSLENNIKLYSSELFQALLKASNYKLDKRIAQTVAEGYARNLDYSDPELMHVGVTSVANNLLTKIKQEYFNVQYFKKPPKKELLFKVAFFKSKVQARKTGSNAPKMVHFFFLNVMAICQLQWVEEKLRSRKDTFRPFLFDVQSDKNPFFEVFKVSKTKGISFDEFNEIIRCFQFSVGIGQLKGVGDFLFILKKCFKDSLKERMNLLQIVLNESEKFVRLLILKVKKQELIEIIVVFQVF